MSHPKLATTDHDIHELIQQRWSPRAFDAARPVPRAELLRLFEAARWAPSSRNEQPWRFLILDRDAAPTEWRALFETLSPANQTWAAAAPLLTLSAIRTAYEDTGTANVMSWYDAGQAVAYLTLQATSQGLSLRQMEGFDRARARQACAIPPEFEPAVVIAIGYTGDPDALPLDKHRAAERQPRRRRPLNEFVYERSWGTGLFSTEIHKLGTGVVGRLLRPLSPACGFLWKTDPSPKQAPSLALTSLSPVLPAD